MADSASPALAGVAHPLRARRPTFTEPASRAGGPLHSRYLPVLPRNAVSPALFRARLPSGLDAVGRAEFTPVAAYQRQTRVIGQPNDSEAGRQRPPVVAIDSG